jgi:hypothetical protein
MALKNRARKVTHDGIKVEMYERWKVKKHKGIGYTLSLSHLVTFKQCSSSFPLSYIHTF